MFLTRHLCVNRFGLEHTGRPFLLRRILAGPAPAPANKIGQSWIGSETPFFVLGVGEMLDAVLPEFA
jgi:hypothetical protein